MYSLDFIQYVIIFDILFQKRLSSFSDPDFVYHRINEVYKFKCVRKDNLLPRQTRKDSCTVHNNRVELLNEILCVVGLDERDEAKHYYERFMDYATI